MRQFDATIFLKIIRISLIFKNKNRPKDASLCTILLCFVLKFIKNRWDQVWYGMAVDYLADFHWKPVQRPVWAKNVTFKLVDPLCLFFIKLTMIIKTFQVTHLLIVVTFFLNSCSNSFCLWCDSLFPEKTMRFFNGYLRYSCVVAMVGYLFKYAYYFNIVVLWVGNL